jgi:excisionase family DNA binding protein
MPRMSSLAEYAEVRIEPLLSLDETARCLGVSRRSVQRLAAGGEFPVVRVGQRAMFIPADIRNYIERQRVAAIP